MASLFTLPRLAQNDEKAVVMVHMFMLPPYTICTENNYIDKLYENKTNHTIPGGGIELTSALYSSLATV